MKRLYVTICLILFQVSYLQAPKTENPETASANSQTTKGGILPTSSFSSPTLDPKDKLLLERLLIREEKGPHSLTRLKSVRAEDADEALLSLSDEDRTNVKDDLHDIQKLGEKNKSEPHYRHKYWPKELPHTGSMTPYRYLLDTIPDLEYFKPPKEREMYKDITTVRIWTLLRHDIRYPSKETAHGMRTRLRNFKESVFLKLYENEDLHDDNSVINMEDFVMKLDAWDVVVELSQGLVFVSNDTLNIRKSKEELEKELENLPQHEKEARLKKRKGADEQIEEAKDLTPLGKEEMRGKSKRFKGWFKDLLENAEPESRLFKFTDCQRTRASAKVFYSEIYGEVTDEDQSWHAPIDTGEEGKDPLLKYDALCGHWKKNYKKSSLNAHQLDAFVTGNDMKTALKGMRDIMRFPKKTFTFSDGKMFYESCAFELAWKRDNPWCIYITITYQAVFEYNEDYEFYKNDGPDNDVNKKVGCFLFRDMIKRLIGNVVKDQNDEISWDLQLEEDGIDKGTITIKPDETDSAAEKTEEPDSLKGKPDEIDETNIKKVTFYFTHLTAILKFITHLGVHLDKEKLTVDNYENMKNRKWRSARIGAFGTSISFVLMKHGKVYYILVLHQERPLILPGCEDELCPVGTFLKSYHDSIFNCNYQAMCEKYKHPFFGKSLKPFRDTTPHTDIASLSFSSTSSAGSRSPRSFKAKEV